MRFCRDNKDGQSAYRTFVLYSYCQSCVGFAIMVSFHEFAPVRSIDSISQTQKTRCFVAAVDHFFVFKFYKAIRDGERRELLGV